MASTFGEPGSDVQAIRLPHRPHGGKYTRRDQRHDRPPALGKPWLAPALKPASFHHLPTTAFGAHLTLRPFGNG